MRTAVAALVPKTYGRYCILAMIFASSVWMHMSFVIAVYQAMLVSALLLPQKLLQVRLQRELSRTALKDTGGSNPQMREVCETGMWLRCRCMCCCGCCTPKLA